MYSYDQLEQLTTHVMSERLAEAERERLASQVRRTRLVASAGLITRLIASVDRMRRITFGRRPMCQQSEAH